MTVKIYGYGWVGKAMKELFPDALVHDPAKKYINTDKTDVSFVYPEKRGFSSKCIPKDVYSWAAWAESLGYKPQLIKALLARNEQWLTDKTS
ncbi:hypothetical protein COU91_02715 [Candidatus Saccharibacteria bacterium CG10_big_fil_rev_8_21_14_0_10_47_8]|nr:MAG: hypothetical protein COU91_02715 [Candidatus Saccharibacteria bacterium CG10_big_fil_rev_8_21_14_0_10_47_8]